MDPEMIERLTRRAHASSDKPPDRHVNARREGHLHLSFACMRPDGRMARVPSGRCVIEHGEDFAAICWEQEGKRYRAKLSIEVLLELLSSGKLSVGGRFTLL